MCVVMSVPIKYAQCTLPGGVAHIAYNQRVLTNEWSWMTPETISKLDCKNEKTERLSSGDPVCKDIVQTTEIMLASSTIHARCPACEQMLLYDDSNKSQDHFFVSGT